MQKSTLYCQQQKQIKYLHLIANVKWLGTCNITRIALEYVGLQWHFLTFLNLHSPQLHWHSQQQNIWTNISNSKYECIIAQYILLKIAVFSSPIRDQLRHLKFHISIYWRMQIAWFLWTIKTIHWSLNCVFSNLRTNKVKNKIKLHRRTSSCVSYRVYEQTLRLSSNSFRTV